MVISIIAVVTRDTEQSLSSKEYETSYNVSEEKMLTLLDTYSDVDVGLTGLLSQGCSLAGELYTCQYQQDNLITNVSVTDTNRVENFELGKDETFSIILNDYTGILEISWTNDIALEMSLEYRVATADPNTNLGYKMIEDVYDQTGIFTQSGASSADHVLNYAVDVNNPKLIQINMNNAIPGVAAADITTKLKIKPLMKGENTSTLISVQGDNSLPKQVRKFEGVSYYESVGAPSSAPTLITQIPLADKLPEILNYVLRSETIVDK